MSFCCLVFNLFQKMNKKTSNSSKNEFIHLVFGRIHGLIICFRNSNCKFEKKENSPSKIILPHCFSDILLHTEIKLWSAFFKDSTLEAWQLTLVAEISNWGTIFAPPKISSKVHIFWEGHKILQNFHLTFVQCSASQK